MKKIKVSIVQKQADVQVIFVDASLISKALRAQIALDRIIETLKADGCIIPRYDTETDADEKCIPILDEKGNQLIDYTCARLEGEELAVLNETVLPFLTELTNAFEE